MDFKINLDLSQVIHITAPEHDNDVVSISSKSYIFEHDSSISLIIQKAPGSSTTIRQLTIGNGLEVNEGALQIRFEGGKLENGRYYYEAFDVRLGKRIFRGWLHILPATYHFAVSHEENAFNGGKSAFQHWLDAGNTGRLSDFLSSLKAEKPNHEWRGTELRFERSDGSWSPWVDLKADKPTFQDFTPEEISQLRIRVEDLSPENRALLKLQFSDLTPEEKEELKLKFPDLSQAEKKSLKGEKGDQPNIEWRGTELRIENTDGSWSPWVDLKGEQGLAPEHEWNGTKCRFQNQDGTWGEFVDLKAKTIPLTQDQFDALNGAHELDVPYYIIEN